MPKIDLADYKGREQAFVKHCLLEEYLPQLGLKVGSKWDTLVYVDGFAGPWGSVRPDFSDSSFAIGLGCMRKCMNVLADKGRRVRVICLFNELKPTPFEKLDAYAKSQDRPGFTVKAFLGRFEDQVPKLNSAIAANAKNPFKFVFLDPKGWKDIPMSALIPLLSGRSSEVLINLMTTHITRFLNEESRASSYERLFGRPGVLEALQEHPGGNALKAERAVQEYCRSLHQLCGFKYVSQAVILSPAKDQVLYYLIYGTNHHRGIEVFKAAEIAAAEMQIVVRQQVEDDKSKMDSLFTFEKHFDTTLRNHYRALARLKVLSRLAECQDAKGIRYADLFCDAMAFPLVTPEDLISWLVSFAPEVQMVLGGSSKRRIPHCDEDDWVIVPDDHALEKRVPDLLME